MRDGATMVSLNLPDELLERLDLYWHKRRFKNRTKAIEYLLDFGLKMDPPNLEQ